MNELDGLVSVISIAGDLTVIGLLLGAVIAFAKGIVIPRSLADEITKLTVQETVKEIVPLIVQEVIKRVDEAHDDS